MGARLDQLSSAEIDHIEQSRLRAQRRAERRELATELSVGVLFLAGAAAMAVLLPRDGGGWGMLVWLAALCAVLIGIEFEVGEGHTRPVQLVFVPMLLLLSPGLVPLAVALAHLPTRVYRVVRGQTRLQRLPLSFADSSFALAPALVLAVAWPMHGVWVAAAVCALALLALMVADLAVSCFRMYVGLGMDPRSELRGFLWVYLVDACLAPVGFFAGLAGHSHPALLAAVLPVGGLLAVFARERRGRIENAFALQQVAQEGRDRLQSLVQHSSDCILIVDADGSLQSLTGSVEPIFGADWSGAEGGSLLAHVHAQDRAPVHAFLSAVAGRSPDEPLQEEWRMRYADGSDRHVAAVATNLLDDVRVGGIVITLRDVEDRKAFEEQLRHRAFHDTLTGLANRALFYDRIEHALSLGGRQPGQVGVLFVDLDDFKEINDVRGHVEGDRLLQEVARRLGTCLRAADTAARLGGDEFGILLEGVADAEAVLAASVRVLDALGRPIELADGKVTVQASIGMAMNTAQDHGVEELLRKADLAMYAAKRHGKGRAELYRAHMEDGAGARGSQWFERNDEQRDEILDVLADPEGITMVFQPIMDLRTGRVAGYESLSRFNREPRRGPDVWFAQAHRCGLGYALEAKAIVAALATPGRPDGIYLTFNLSPSSLLSDEIRRVLPERLDGLVVEITENELVSGDPAILAALDEFRSRGARLAVDDTGAGYAGLTHVMRLQPDIIKLDRALTTGVDSDAAKAPLISSFVRYARDIDAVVCAEGVETLGELRRLADLDVAYGQGYGIARPSAPWVDVAEAAAEACLRSFEISLADDDPARDDDHDRRLEILARQLAGVASPAALEECLGPIAAELQADEVRLVAPAHGNAHATELLADDPSADPSERAALQALGFGSRLTLPIAHGGRIVGCLEAHAVHARPWSRFQVGRGRIIACLLGPLLDAGLAPAPSPSLVA